MTETKSDAPTEWWKTEDTCRILSQHFSTHMVGLFLLYKTQETRHPVLYSGFLHSHGGVPLWMSAGHVFSELDKLQESGVEIVEAEWIDLVNDGSRHGIPLDLRDLLYWQIDKAGIDFGVAFLRPHYANLFRSSERNAFLDDRGIIGRDSAQPEGFYLLGFPSERHEVSEREVGSRMECSLSAPLYCLPLEEIPDRPGDEPATFWGCDGCKYFQIVPFRNELSPPPGDIKFMSGGPIVSIERAPDGTKKYYFFGVQSAWLPKQRIIRITDSVTIGVIIDELFKSALEESPPGQTGNQL